MALQLYRGCPPELPRMNPQLQHQMVLTVHLSQIRHVRNRSNLYLGIPAFLGKKFYS